MNEIIRSIESAQLKTDIPKFAVGDTVRVQVKVVEGSRERLQAFEGVVIARRNGSVRETFTVRRTSYGVGVERTFPLHSPRVDSITVVRRGKVRRAKLLLQQAPGFRHVTGIPIDLGHGNSPLIENSKGAVARGDSPSRWVDYLSLTLAALPLRWRR